MEIKKEKIQITKEFYIKSNKNFIKSKEYKNIVIPTIKKLGKM